ncbi:hypothetical protein ACFQ8C_28140 [Streptomyces sp. NPDC056503]|uniref:hypothetical protein n=1 Tax=Streptomyces sp. NPDC056503 TaxID=3345842 RepID=UPI00367A7403
MRVTAQGSTSRALMALSAVVVAACALTVTIKVMATDVKTAHPWRVLDQEALERQVAAYARGPMKTSRDGVICPIAAEARPGNKFWCRVDDTNIVVEVKNDQGDLSISKL